MNILGLSAFYHDAAACLVQDGRVVAAAQEERFTRIKHDPSYPSEAVAYCLREGGISARQLDRVVFYDKPWRKFDRLLKTWMAVAPRGWRSFLAAMPVWLKQKLWLRHRLREALEGYEGAILFTEHHEAHGASAFFPSPFEEAAILTVDGVGEWATASQGFGQGREIRLHREMHFPHSPGMLYSAFTYYTGFRVNSGEYKVMGLAPYGEARFVEQIYEHLVDLKSDGSFRLNTELLGYLDDLRMTNERFDEVFGGPPRSAEAPLRQRDMDLAASVQAVMEEIMLRQARHLHRETGSRKLCLAGGCALNCVANGRILREGPFEEIWIQPAAGDAGGALGAALFVWHQLGARERRVEPGQDAQGGSRLGPAWSDEALAARIEEWGLPHEGLGEEELPSRVATLIEEGKVVGWFQGRMEFGPRALGGRSILGDARSPDMQKRMNLKIKFRESFRPFAPSVLEERVSEWFDLDRPSPYMLLTAPVAEERLRTLGAEELSRTGLARLEVERSSIPAVTHVDGSARLQTVSRSHAPRYHALLEAFERSTGCPVIINTSFNVRGEPIVCSPEDAYRCFRRTHMDCLVLGTCLLHKEEQPDRVPGLEWNQDFNLD